MRKSFTILTLVCIIIGASCTTKHKHTEHQIITPDPGVNINTAPPYPLQDDSVHSTPTNADSIEDTSMLQMPTDSTSYWADMYMDDFINWEERVGMKQMLGWKWYPAWYGGFYIENGKMVFMLTSESGVKTLPEGAIWKKCKYSHNELEAIKQKISNEVYKHLDIFESAGFTIDDETNRVVVYLQNNSPEALQFFKKNIYDGDTVIIE
ncbi:MAG: hypothetical protein HDR88_15360 [Bacteroides sp.]|nr:hypothetical protein [Bacteroides sp.]